MFVYLSKKIAIPNCDSVDSVAWQNEDGWIACGGNSGLLKVLQLDGGGSTLDLKSGGSNSQLSMNQTLEGHHEAVVLCTWNNKFQKLTSADASGLIIAFGMKKWLIIEKANCFNKGGLVTGMKWSSTGEKICIVYDDGAVILGSVDGNRIWGKEIKNTKLDHVAWSPDNNFLIFATSKGQLHIFDSNGTFAGKINDYCHAGREVKVAGLDWFNASNGNRSQDSPALAVCYEDGFVQLHRNQNDKKPVVFRAELKGIKLQWNNDGTILAIVGRQTIESSKSEMKESCVLQFRDGFGNLLKSIKIPGNKISSLSWDYNGLRIAVGVDACIYFANVRPDYQYSFFAKNILTYPFTQSESKTTSLMFWNIKTDERFIRPVNNFECLTASGENALVVTKLAKNSQETTLTIYDAIGICCESKILGYTPKIVAISNSYVVTATRNIISVWQYRSAFGLNSAILSALRNTDCPDRTFHIDNFEQENGLVAFDDNRIIEKQETADPISAIAVSDNSLIIARESGAVLQLAMPSLKMEFKYQCSPNISKISINCSFTKCVLVNKNGQMHKLVLGSKFEEGQLGGLEAGFERKDVWDVLWSEVSSDVLATMEKTKLIVFNGSEIEEPIVSPGYLCSFNDLKIMSVSLDEIMKTPSQPSIQHSLSYESKPLRELRSIVFESGVKYAMDYVEEQTNMNLWRTLAELALEKSDYEAALKCFVKCLDYQGFQFVKRINRLEDEDMRKAEAATFCEQFDKAEAIYLEKDRQDLALEMRMQIGDWFRVVSLINSSGGGNDNLYEMAWNKIGDYYYDQQNWSQAINFYMQGRNNAKLVELWYQTEDFMNLEKLASSLSENDALLKNIADKFLSVGMCRQAVDAYMKLGNVAAAVNACVYLNQWNVALELSEHHQVNNFESILTNYANDILSRNRKKEAVELYRRANFCQQGAKLLFDLAQESIKQNRKLLTIKKLFVLGALEIERYHNIKKMTKPAVTIFNKTTAAIDSMLSEDKINIKLDLNDTVWRGAEAYHFYILAQKQFYRGQADAAVVTCLNLLQYQDFLGPVKIFSLLALVSLHSEYYYSCSKALSKLESMQDRDFNYYQELAFEIFSKYIYIDTGVDRKTQRNCPRNALIV